MKIINRDQKMVTTANWSQDDIEKLKEEFLKGLPIKLIAKVLGRTPGAVNKALSRFQVRTPRIFKERTHKDQCLRLAKLAIERERELKSKIHWASLQDVIKWLQEDVGDRVAFSDGCILINNRPMTKMQLTMYANKKRLENGFEIFLVEDVTW